MAVLKEVAHRLLLQSPSRPEANTSYKHIESAIGSYEHPIRLFRTVDEFVKYSSGVTSDSLTYADMNDKLPELDNMTAFNCHHGQKKLVMSLLEFIADALKTLRTPEEELTVVYPGASGLAVSVAATIFQRARFVLYDPAPNTTELIPESKRHMFSVFRTKHAKIPMQANRVIVYTEKAGYFDDAEALKFADVPNVLLVSDVRMVRIEQKIAEDMRNQQRWILLSGAVAYMVKFRIPYKWNASIKSCYDLRNITTIEPKRKIVILDDGHPKELQYLDGGLYIQLYPKQKTAELRLIGYAPKNVYKIRNYKIGEIEDALALFNAVYRSHACFKTGRHSASFFTDKFPSYEKVAEYDIALRILASIGGAKKSDDVMALLSIIESSVDSFKTSMEKCVRVTNEKVKRRLPESVVKSLGRRGCAMGLKNTHVDKEEDSE
jgi:hypothetical protein